MDDLEIIVTQDGSHSLLSHRYGVSYHSRYGAIQESKHVFLESGLFTVAPALGKVRILEIGFGTGLNAVLTFVEAKKRGWAIRYEAVEGYPLELHKALSLNYSELIDEPEVTSVYEQMHRQAWGDVHGIAPFFELSKRNELFEDLHYPTPAFDLIYFDAFAPNAQPELWELPLLEVMENALIPGGVLVTYCAKGSFKRNLKTLGFSIEALPGPPGKREMTRARKPITNSQGHLPANGL